MAEDSKQEHSLDKNSSKKIEKHEISTPFLGLVPIPSLLIDRVDIDFQMEATESSSASDKDYDENIHLPGLWLDTDGFKKERG